MRGLGRARVSVVYCFEWYGDHRDLHSFPTRRSSDLVGGDGAEVAGRRAVVPSRQAHDPDHEEREDGTTRSEEHTSELQSRRDLVCRLLLEKKKPYSTTSSGLCKYNL